MKILLSCQRHQFIPSRAFRAATVLRASTTNFLPSLPRVIPGEL